jgi:hypothetical protein
MFSRYFIIVAAILLASCISQHYVPDVDAVLRDSPKIELLAKDKPASRTAAESIEAYYFWWNPLTRPDAVKNWKEIYVMGESSSPAWPYTRIASVEIAQRARDDTTAMKTLRSLASDLGGDALIDLRRDPMIDKPQFGARILGFRYLATVVRRSS